MAKKNRDYIPRNLEEYDTFMGYMVTYVAKKLPEWKDHIPPERLQTLVDKVVAFQSVYIPLKGMNLTKDQREQIKKLQNECTAEARPFVQQYLNFPPVENHDRTAMSLPNHDKVPTRAPIPSSIPEIEVDSSVIRRLRLRTRRHGAKSWGKPEHVASIEFAWGICNGRPAQVEDIPHKQTLTSNPLILDFEEEDRGKRVYFAARWLNSRAEPGPWSDIESAIVP